MSLHEPDARPIRKGRLGKPVEFGYKAQVIDNPAGLIIDHSVHIGNPSDNELLRPAIERITTHLGVTPSLVTADRGYWDSTIEDRPRRRRGEHRRDPPHRQTLRSTSRASNTPTSSSPRSSGAPDAKAASPT